MDESMMYAMNNVIDGENGSHRQGIKTLMDMDGDCSYPIDKKGERSYALIMCSTSKHANGYCATLLITPSGKGKHMSEGSHSKYVHAYWFNVI